MMEEGERGGREGREREVTFSVVLKNLAIKLKSSLFHSQKGSDGKENSKGRDKGRIKQGNSVICKGELHYI
jgi:hypothetical protein